MTTENKARAIAAAARIMHAMRCDASLYENAINAAILTGDVERIAEYLLDVIERRGA